MFAFQRNTFGLVISILRYSNDTCIVNLNVLASKEFEEDTLKRGDDPLPCHEDGWLMKFDQFQDGGRRFALTNIR